MRFRVICFARLARATVLRVHALMPWMAVALLAGHANAAPQDGAMRLELTTAYNFIVDSNVESPSTYAPRAAYISARIWNDGTVPITNVRAYIGDRIANTPGIYPSRLHPENTNITGPLAGGAFALTHEGGSLGALDATRQIPSIPPGGYVPVYWLVSYPNLDVNGKSVTGGAKPNDDLYLFYDIWATGDEGVTPRTVDVRRRVTMRSCISAMANKIFPNTANKVPTQYQQILDTYSPEWNNIAADGSPGTNIRTEGIWYDLGNVTKGFDNDGNLVPDQNAWLQPVGDPSLFDPSAFRLVKSFALIIVKLKGGGEVVYDVTDQLYFSNLPDNTGVIGLVRYDYLPLKAGATSFTTPYQMAASGFDNEKFNGDYGTSFGLSSPPSALTLDKTVDEITAGPGDPLLYTIDFSNPGDQTVGDPGIGMPLVVQDRIPAGTTYVGGTAATGNTLPSGVSAYEIRYSTDDGATWTTTEPSPASDVTDIQWWLSDPLAPDASGTVTFSVDISDPYPLGGQPVLNIAALSFGNSVPFLEDDAVTFIQGNLNISGTTFGDTGVGAGGIYGDGIQNGDEPSIASVTVSLYYDANNNGIVDAGDILIETVDTDGSGLYSFVNLPNGEYVVQVDRLDSNIPSGYTITSAEQLAVTLSGVDSTGNDFGFAPTLTVTKTGTLSAYPGDPVSYTINVANQYTATRQNIYNRFATGTTTGSGNKAWLNPANAEGETDGTFAEGLFDNAAETLTVNGYAAPPVGSTITGVELVMVGRGLNIGAANTNGSLAVSATGVTLNAASLANITDPGFNVTAPDTYTFVRPLVKTAGAWTLAEVTAFAMTFTTNKPTGNNAADFFLDSVELRITVTQSNTLTTVPLTDTYNADELEFVSAVPAPDSTNVSGSVGTLSWDNVGPIEPGDFTEVTVNFIAKPLPGVNPIITTDTASVTGAEFENGDPANDGEASAETEILPTASIGDTIFVDTNRSGSQDVGEPGIPGVTVELLDSSNTVIATEVTDANGVYLFENLIPGEYTVRVVTDPGPLVGWTLSSDPDLDGVPFDPLNPDPLGDSQTTQTLAGGQFYSGADFGYFPPGYALSGIVWIDFDDDGVVDENEIGLQFVTVSLYDGSNNLIGTTTTDENGAYTFAGLSNGSYHTQVDVTTLPANLTQTFEADTTINNENQVTIADADADDVNFGYRYAGTNSLSGTIGLDGDPVDGLLNGTDPTGVASDEMPFSNVTVFLYTWNDLNDDDLIDSGELLLLAATTTDANGDYSFTGLPDADFYIVSINVPMNNLFITTTSATVGHPADVIVTSENSQGHTTGAYAIVPVAENIQNVDFAFESAVEYDFGDLPDTYSTLLLGGARHIVRLVPDLYLGAGVSIEENGQPSANADEDTLDDGVFVKGIWKNGIDGGSVEVEVFGSGWLVGFIDFNQSGNFDQSSELIVSQSVSTDTYIFEFDVPQNTLDVAGSTGLYSRFRLLPTEPFVPELSFTGEAANGEVEDYLWNFHSIIGTVYGDADDDSQFSSGDDVVNGVVIGLYLDSVLIDSRITGFDGGYSFYGLPPGNYEVRMVTPVGALAILDADGSGNGDDRIDVSVTDSTVTGRDFLLGQDGLSYASISGTVFLDADKDTDFSLGDIRFSSVVISLYLDLDDDGVADPGEFIGSVTTDSNGNYLFPNLVDGKYLIVMSVPNGATAILDADGDTNGDDFIAVTLAGTDVVERDFLLDSNMSLSGTIRIDLDEDDDGDVPHPGVVVQLLSSDDTIVATTVTNADGFYIFAVPNAGDYKVRQIVPTGYDAIWDVDGVDFTIIGDQVLITVEEDDDVTGQDFVNREQPGAIGDFVWIDANGNGIQDDDEVGLEGVTVNLLDSDDNVVDTTTTGPDGGYLFTLQSSGTYRVQFVLPAGYVFTIQNADNEGLDGALNSDANRSTGTTGNIALTPGGSNLNVDAGAYLQSCPDLWIDWQILWHDALNGETGLFENPDADRYSNLIEYAFCLPPDLGVRKPFCLVPSATVDGGIDGVFSRTAIGGGKDLTYVLEWTAALGSPTTWTHSEVLDGTNTVVTNDGNGKEIVRIPDLQTFTGLGGAGFVRIRVDLDNGIDEESDHTDVLGWVETNFGLCCSTYCNPFLECAVFTGTVDEVDDQDLVFNTSAAGFDLGMLLEPGVAYYIEVETGTLEGHRFDITGGGEGFLTIANDSDLFAFGGPHNTLTGAAPAALEGSRIALHRHRTMDSVFPKEAFAGTEDPTTADRVQFNISGQWFNYWLHDDGDEEAIWTTTENMDLDDFGSLVIPPGRGMFLDNRGGQPRQVIAFGEVREHAFANPLPVGSSLIAGGYPVDQAPRGANSREMTLATGPGVGFFGSRNFATADSIFRWRPDDDSNANGYDAYFLAVVSTGDFWYYQPELPRVDRSSDMIFERDRSVFLRVRDGYETYRISPPWTADAPDP